MSGLQFAWNTNQALPVMATLTVLIGKSTNIHAGDVLIKTIGATYTGTGGSQYPVVRPLLSGDAVTSSNGYVGVALFDIQTDATGKITSQSSAVTVDTRGQLQVRSIGQSLPVDPVSGYTQIYIASFARSNVFKGFTSTNELANFYDVERACGVLASSATFPANYTIEVPQGNSIATTAFGRICVGVDTESANFNSAAGGGAVFVSCKPTFYQEETGNLWTT